MTLKEQLIKEIEQASEESLLLFLNVWQQTKQTSESLSTFFHNSPLAEYCAEQELDFSRDASTYGDRFEL